MPSLDMMSVPTPINQNGGCSISTSARYDTIAARLTSALPDLRSRLGASLACALTGMIQAVSA